VLVLTRKIGEGIAIGDDVKIIVMQIKGKQVRLGIKASSSTAVHREEVFQKIQDENRAASQPHEHLVNEAKDIIGHQPWGVGQVPIRRHVKASGGGGGADDS
jgi:carbon storage regulator